jgi:hypothetical protein
MPAGIEERVDLAIDVAIEDQFPVHHLADHEVAFVRHLGLMGENDPRPVQDPATLLFEDLWARVGGAVHKKSAALSVDPQVAGPGRKWSLDDSSHGALLLDRTWYGRV